MIREKVCIAIPIYKETLTLNEENSMIQCFDVLGTYPIILFGPSNLNLDYYYNLIPNGLSFSFIGFDPIFFKDIEGYNKLMLSLHFYKRFKTYQFMLLYQLDAWVFENRLNLWCQAGYDYVGAPWFEGFTKANKSANFLGVGNGGFSLRKVSSHIKVLKHYKYNRYPKYACRLLRANFSARLLKRLTLRFLDDDIFENKNILNQNEDLFWSFEVVKFFSNFKIPEMKIALEFAVEVNPSKFIKDENSLPFGCHGWEKYEPEFWRQYIHIKRGNFKL